MLDNTVQDLRDGIYVEYSDANEIKGNMVSRSRYGLHFMYTQDNIVKNNRLVDNHTGSMMMVSYNDLYEGNTLLENRRNVNSQGLYLYDVHDAMIKANHINDNRIGIMIDNSFTNTITQNEFKGNALGIIFKQSTDNDITKNDFKINATTILTYGDGSKENNLYGNYWDNQMSLDANGDRFSDLEVVADPYFMEITDKNSAFQLLFQSPGMVLMEKLLKSNEDNLVKDRSPSMIPNIQEDVETSLNVGVMYISILFIIIKHHYLYFREEEVVMKKRWMYFLMVLVVGLAVALAGCNSEQADTSKEKKDEPKVEEPQTKVKAKAIDEAVDKCENCKMAVADNADATEIVLKDGKTLVFDDIGCMVNKWIKTNGTDDIEAAFVRSHHDKEWLDYEKAVYVFDPKITTAMGYGVIAFKDEAGAQNFIDKNGMGTIMTKAELDKHTWPQDKSNMTMKKHKDSMDPNSMHQDVNGTAYEPEPGNANGRE